jgi:hypothetical protein
VFRWLRSGRQIWLRLVQRVLKVSCGTIQMTTVNLDCRSRPKALWFVSSDLLKLKMEILLQRNLRYFVSILSVSLKPSPPKPPRTSLPLGPNPCKAACTLSTSKRTLYAYGIDKIHLKLNKEEEEGVFLRQLVVYNALYK